jgi:hypothetical protein
MMSSEYVYALFGLAYLGFLFWRSGLWRIPKEKPPTAYSRYSAACDALAAARWEFETAAAAYEAESIERRRRTWITQCP